MAVKKRVGASVRKENSQSTTAKSESVTGQPWPALMLFLVPLLALPFMLNARMMSMVLPNEQPKWAVLMIVALLLTFAFAARIWKQHDPDLIRLSWPGVLLGLFFVLLLIGIGIGPNWVEGTIRFAFWASALMVWLSVIMAVRTGCGHESWMAWATGISGFIFSLHYWWNYFTEYGLPGYNISVLFSPVGQVNFTGDVLLVLFPVLLWILARRQELPVQMMCWFSAVTCGSILLIASSRGTLYGLAIGAVLILAFSIRHRQLIFGRSRLLAWLLLVSALLATVVVYEVLPYHFRNLARVSATLSAGEEPGAGQTQPRPAPVTEDQAAHHTGVVIATPVAEDKAVKHTTLPRPPLATLWRGLSPWIGSERTAMYASTAAMIADRPWLGQGTGNFPYIYPKFSHAFPEFEDVIFSTEFSYTTNPHNIFLQLASQNGLPAAIIFMGLLALFFWRLAASLWRNWDGLNAAGVAALAAAIFDAMFNQVFFNPASMFVFALFGGLWWARLPAGPGLISLTLPKWSVAVPFVLALLLAIWPARWLISDWYAARALASEPSLTVMEPNYRLAADLDPYNFRAVYGMAKVGFLHKDYDAVIEHLEWMQQIYPYNAAALNMLGVAYMLKGRLPEAEQALFASLQVLPDYDKAQENIRRLQMWATAPAREVLNKP